MDKSTRNQIIAQLYDQIHQTQIRFLHLWFHHTFLRWDWWISLAMAVLPWVIWWRVRRKASTHRLLYAGFFVIIATGWLDFLGVICGLWYYAGKLVPTMPSYVPFDFCLFPVFVMLLIQWRIRIHAALKALGFAVVSAFVAEPLFQWTGLYTSVHWRHIYSFPIYLAIYLCAHWLSTREAFGKIE